MQLIVAGKNRLAVEGLSLALQHFKPAQVGVIVGEVSLVEKRNFPVFQQAANEYGVRIIELEEAYLMSEAVFLSLEYDRILNPELFSSKKLYNLHLSLLPNYKGVATSAWPIIKGEQHAGTTLHHIDSGIDSGDILAQSKFPIPPCETSFGLHNLLIDSAAELLTINFESLVSGDLIRIPQTGQGSYFRRRDLVFADINLADFKTCEEIQRWFRALYFPIYQMPRFENHEVSHIKITEYSPGDPPGSWRWSECGGEIVVSLPDGTANLKIVEHGNIR